MDSGNNNREMSKGKVVDDINTEKDIRALMHSIVMYWNKLDVLVKAEWKAILSQDLVKLYRLSRGKEFLLENISKSEKELGMLIVSSYPGFKTDNNSEGLLDRFIRSAEFSDRRFLLRFRAERNLLKRNVAVTNKRLMNWIQERLNFSQELLEIYSGQRSRKTATYTPQKGNNVLSLSRHTPKGSGLESYRTTQSEFQMEATCLVSQTS